MMGYKCKTVSSSEMSEMIISSKSYMQQDDVKSEKDSQQMVSHLRKNLPFGLQTALLSPTNQVPQVPVGRAGPPPAPASGPAFEIMKVIIMSLSLLPPGRREVKLPMESSHLTHSTSSSRIHHLTGCILHTLVYNKQCPEARSSATSVSLLYWSSFRDLGTQLQVITTTLYLDHIFWR